MSQAPIAFRFSTNLLGGFGLPGSRGLLILRGRCITLLEAGAAAGVAALQEGRRQVVTAAISADQLFRAGWRVRRPRRSPWGLGGFRNIRSLRLSADGRLFCGRYRFAALVDQRCRHRFVISVHVKSPSRARAWYSCRREHTLLCRCDVGSDSSHRRSKIVGTQGEQPWRGRLGLMPRALPMDLPISRPDKIRPISPIGAAGGILRVRA